MTERGSPGGRAEPGGAGRAGGGAAGADGRGGEGATAPTSSGARAPAAASGAQLPRPAVARRLRRDLRLPAQRVPGRSRHGRGAEAEPPGGAGGAPAARPGLGGGGRGGGRGGSRDGARAGGRGGGGPPDPGRRRGGRAGALASALSPPRSSGCLRAGERPGEARGCGGEAPSAGFRPVPGEAAVPARTRPDSIAGTPGWTQEIARSVPCAWGGRATKRKGGGGASPGSGVPDPALRAAGSAQPPDSRSPAGGIARAPGAVGAGHPPTTGAAALPGGRSPHLAEGTVRSHPPPPRRFTVSKPKGLLSPPAQPSGWPQTV